MPREEERPAVPLPLLNGVPGQELLARAWRPEGSTLAERARRTRIAALQLGIWSLDPAARVLLQDASLGSPLERAEAAALLAPELPDAHAALASARLRAADPVGAVDAALAALSAFDQHPEASAWLRVSLADAAARIVILGGFLVLGVAGLGAAAALVTPLALRLGIPAYSAAALIAAFALAPAALGEGLVGIGFAAAALGFARGGIAARAAVLAAACLVLAGIHPLAEARDRALVELASDPLAMAVSSTERDFATPLDLVRLGRAADDPLARRALALHARRSGDIVGADQRFRALLAEGEPSAELLNNAANTRLDVGGPEEALALYEQAVHENPSPLVLFNLAQAYGRAILLDEQDLALAQAQALDARAVHALTQHVAEVGATGGPVDVTISPEDLRARSAAAPVGETSLAREFAPGWLGGGAVGGAAGLLLAAGVGLVVGIPLRRLGGDDLYAGIARLLQGREKTDSALRMARLAALRAREARMARLRGAAAWLVPGAAAFQAGRGFLALVSALLAATVVVALYERGGLVPDPLACALAGRLAFTGAALLALLLCAGLQALSIVLLRRRG